MKEKKVRMWNEWAAEVRAKATEENLPEITKALRKIYSCIKFLAMTSGIKNPTERQKESIEMCKKEREESYELIEKLIGKV